jgi:signal transduction histidine kinase
MNAAHAVEDGGKGSGRLRVATRTDGGDVVIEVTDDGCGIPPDALPKIFDPFFTTKPVGRGTGLGLSISHGIVAEHGGRIEVEAAAGGGTCFRVHLPLERPVAPDGQKALSTFTGLS